MITHNQLELADVFSECQDIFETDKPRFLTLLEENIDLEALIPCSFAKNYYSYIGRPRTYGLVSMLWALILQRILSIPTDSLLIVFLHYSRHLRRFCGFDKVPDASKITRFKQDFAEDLEELFKSLVDLTEPICQAIDASLASMTTFDTSGIEAWVTENNPKYANSLIRRLQAWKKAHNVDDSYDPYKAAYASMPSSASANPEIKQMYIDGHFCYAYKIGFVTNGLGIVRHLEFYDEEYYQNHACIEREAKKDSPDELKTAGDSKLLIPTLRSYFNEHPQIRPDVFLGDAAFDSIEIYTDLLTGETFGATVEGNGIHFNKAYIPLNSRGGLKKQDYTVNEDGVPCCPNDPSLPMKPEGNTSNLRSGTPTLKFVCPKMKWEKDPETGKYHRQCHCENPCTKSSCGRMIYVYPEQDLRAYPGTVRGTDEWKETYKIRTNVERTINHFKGSFGLAGRKTQNKKTLRADLYLSGITQLITVLLADKIHRHDCIRSVKSLIA
jgi:transposase